MMIQINLEKLFQKYIVMNQHRYHLVLQMFFNQQMNHQKYLKLQNQHQYLQLIHG
jgi:hypothetical protein